MHIYIFIYLFIYMQVCINTTYYIYILSTGSLDLALQEAALTHIRHRDA